MDHNRGLAVRILTFLYITGSICAQLVSGQDVTISVSQHPTKTILTDRSNGSHVTAIRFEDYVSNPRPNRGDSSQGWVDTYDSPFDGLVMPNGTYTTQNPLPKPAAVLLESSSGTVGFYDATSLADCSDAKADNLIFRFVNPNQPQKAALVSRVAFAVSGTAVRDKSVKFSLYDLSDRLLHTGIVTPGAKLNGLRSDIECIAEQNGQETAGIHKLVLENTAGGYFVVGTIQDVKENDLAYAGLKITDQSVRRDGLEIPPIAHSKKWSHHDQAVLLTDMSCCEPKTSLSTKRKKGTWKIFDYETKDFQGKALSINAEAEPPIISLEMNRKGWHAIYVGLSTVAEMSNIKPNMIKVKLTSESSYGRISNLLKLAPRRRDVVEEIYVKAADLTGEKLMFGPERDNPALLCYVKLVPLTEEEVAQIKEQRQRKGAKPLVATFDGHHWICPYNIETKDDLRSMFYFFPDTDFNIWWFQVLGADMTHYQSKVGNIPGYDLDVFPRPVDRNFTENAMNLAAKGINTLKVAVDAGHEQGAQVLVMIRAQGWKGSHPWEEYFSSDFYEAHPEWRCVDYDGTPTMYMSYAVPEVQDHLVDVLKEALETGADGAGVIYHRGLPNLLWEKPFRERFHEKYGVNPLDIPEDDPRVYALRSDIMTEFMQKIRALLDQARRKTGREKRMPLAVSTFATKADNEKYGLDLERWIKLDLIDQVGPAWFAYHTSMKNPVDIAYYEGITKNTKVDVFPFVIGWRLMNPAALTDEVAHYYRQGAEGIAVWDPASTQGWREAEGNSWPILGQLGHEQDVINGNVLRYKPNQVELTRLGENYYSRWFPNTGF